MYSVVHEEIELFGERTKKDLQKKKVGLNPPFICIVRLIYKHTHFLFFAIIF